MNGVHDMGGMHGMGPIQIEENEPVFHSEWEARVFALCFATFENFFPTDETRSAVERIGQSTYLQSSYYERWLAGLELLLIEHGYMTLEELTARIQELQAEEIQA